MFPIELFANNATTTLSGAISSTGATSLTVTSATGFPTAGNFRVIVDSEIMLVTAVSGTTFTIERGKEGTTAATHSSGATIACVLTRGSLLAASDGLSGDESKGSSLSVQFQGTTTSSTQAELYLSGVSGRRLTCPDNTSMFVDIRMVGRATNSDNQFYQYCWAAVDNDGATTVVANSSYSYNHATTTAASVSFSVSGDDLRFLVTGPFSHNITWNCYARVTYVTAVYVPAGTT